MDLFNPADKRPVHFLGIGGAGHERPRADRVPPGSRGHRMRRRSLGGGRPQRARACTVHAGHDPSHLEGARAVVVTAAVPADHPELRRARELDLPVVPRKVALAALVGGARSVGVSGTHGKTTTTVMTTEALAAAGLSPTGLAGGRVAAWGGNARIDGDELFVVEADEYDQAFLTLHPTVAIVNNVEADHLECYGSVDGAGGRVRRVRRAGRGGAGQRGRCRARCGWPRG